MKRNLVLLIAVYPYQITLHWRRIHVSPTMQTACPAALHCYSGASDVLFAAVECDAGFPDVTSCVGYLDHPYPPNRLTTFH
ncbi:hypothetical protein BDV36DRAFT_244509 [Aspergillus pseudocaelatus]|nr:hypothetical protein BDV36DRAFT_244509 [Aspergillus pseudocaelatus]